MARTRAASQATQACPGPTAMATQRRQSPAPRWPPFQAGAGSRPGARPDGRGGQPAPARPELDDDIDPEAGVDGFEESGDGRYCGFVARQEGPSECLALLRRFAGAG